MPGIPDDPRRFSLASRASTRRCNWAMTTCCSAFTARCLARSASRVSRLARFSSSSVFTSLVCHNSTQPCQRFCDGFEPIHLIKSEQLPGDPCPCGCGNFRGEDGRVIVVCQFCGKSRTDEHLKNHSNYCRSCARAIKNPMYPKALKIVRMALVRLGITLKEACTKAGISAQSPSIWIRGVHTPRREFLFGAL